jgi:molybdopterin/thiamine biosynthesis adenylyltransferase
MNEQHWRRERDDRTLRYAGRCLDPARWIAITASLSYIRRYDGQIALLTAANLLSRMSPSIVLAFPDAPVHPALPWPGHSLHELALMQMRSADPYAQFHTRALQHGDYRLHLGADGYDCAIHGMGWNAYVGPTPSPLPAADDGNPFGAAFAVLLAVSQLFAHMLAPLTGRFVANALTWCAEPAPMDLTLLTDDLGTLWVIGTGSVGTAALYFLTMATRSFSAVLIDKDRVELHNLDRSPIFTNGDVGRLKVEATYDFLHNAGVTAVQTEACALHESAFWTERSAGTPDLLIAAANELNVRYHIEAYYPPIQIYGTTGRNWQASVIRHIPFVEACSCCLFPDEVPHAAMACASASVETASHSSPQVDAALPFLSYTAGLMTACEVVKLALPDYPFNANRVTLSTRPSPRLVPARIPKRLSCICESRSEGVHREMIRGSKHVQRSISTGR